MPDVTVADYAKRRGVSVQAVRKAIREERLKASIVQRDPLVLIDSYHADREWARNTRPVVGGRPSTRNVEVVDADGYSSIVKLEDAAPARRRQARSSRPRDDDEDEELDDDGNPIPSIRKEKALKARADRQLAELNLAKAEGRVVLAESARLLWFERIRGVRDAVLAIATRLAAPLAAETDPEKVEALIDAELRAALDKAGAGGPPMPEVES